MWFLAFTHKLPSNAARLELAANVLRPVVRRFVVSQDALAWTSLAKAVDSVSRQCLKESSDDALDSTTTTQPGDDDDGGDGGGDE